MLENPVIVSDEEIKEGDCVLYQHPKQVGIVEPSIHKVINPNYSLVQPAYRVHFDTGWGVIEGCKKVIAQSHQIDWNGLEPEFGYVDVEKLAYQVYPVSKDTRNNITNYDVMSIERSYWIKGFKKAQELNDKKFSLEDMEKAFEEGCLYGGESEEKQKRHFDWFLDKYKSQPKVFDIEVEMKQKFQPDKTKRIDPKNGIYYVPKATEGKIKITRKL